MFRGFTIALAALVSVSVLASPALAQDPDRGPWEMTLVGSGTSDKDFDATQLSAEVGLGVFLGPVILGGRQSIAYTESSFEDVDDFWSASSRAFGDIQLDIGPWSPFIGANFGYVYGDLVDDQFIAGPETGFKWHVGDDLDTFIFFRVEYQFFFEDNDDAEGSIDDGQFVYALGIGFRF